jgi:hypothetical protein
MHGLIKHAILTKSGLPTQLPGSGMQRISPSSFLIGFSYRPHGPFPEEGFEDARIARLIRIRTLS